jgi:preprotein translocase subunit SecG
MTSFMLLARVDFLHYVFAIPMAVLSVFLVLVILVQRGRGGGLTGALGGMGGQSAFGTKAGDLFTRITIVVAALWVLLSMASIKVLAQRQVFDVNQKGMPIPAAPSAKTFPPPGTTPPAATTPPATTPAGPGTSTPAEAPPPAAPASAAPADAAPPATKTEP